MGHTNRANVHIGLHFIGIVLGVAEHLGAGFELGVYFEADRQYQFRSFHTHTLAGLPIAATAIHTMVEIGASLPMKKVKIKAYFAEARLTMDEVIYIQGRPHVSTQQASRILGYDAAYIARFCREGKIAGIVFDKRWLIDAEALSEFIGRHAERKAQWQFRLSQALACPEPLGPTAKRTLKNSLPVITVPRDYRITVAPIGMWADHPDRGRHTEATPLVSWAIYLGAVTTAVVLAVGASGVLQSPHIFAHNARTHVAASALAYEGLASLEQAARDVYTRANVLICGVLPFCEKSLQLAHDRTIPFENQTITAASRDRALTPLVVTNRVPAATRAAPVSSTPSAARAPATTSVVERIIERVVERASVAAAAFVTESSLGVRLSDLEQRLSARIDARPQFSGGGAASPAYSGTFGVSQSIDQLSGATITGGTISGASISGGSLDASSLSGPVAIDKGGTGAASFTQGWLYSNGGTSAIAASSSPTVSYLTASSTNATSTFAGGILGTRAPSLAHTFSTWAAGVANAHPFDAALVINPASAAGDTNLISASVNGAVRFLVDAEGDLFVNSLTSVGSVTLSTTSASTFSVEGNSTLGDSITDVTTVNGTLTVTGTTTSASVAGKFAVGSTTPWAKLSVHAMNGDTNDMLFAIGSSTANSTTTLLSVSNTGVLTFLSATGTSATTTNFFSTLGRFANSTVDTLLTATQATITTLTATTLTATNASTTVASAYDGLFVGRTATSTIRGDGVASILPYASSTAITISGTGYIGNGAFTSTSGTTTIASGQGFAIGSSQFVLQQSSGAVGVGTTSPWGLLSINPSGISGPAFVIGSSTATRLTVSNGGRVGIGLANPSYTLDVAGDINFTGKLYEDGTEVFASMIAPFASACPTGWTEYTAARGRAVVGTPSGGTNAGTVGSALTNLGTRTTTDTAAHTHSVDPPNTGVSVSDPGHSHTGTNQGLNYFATNDASNDANLAAGGGQGNINTGTASAATGITAAVDIASFTSGSSGVASVDVTMPYIQLTYCQKTAGADIAEWIPSNQDLSKETIVSIDPDNREKVVTSAKEYDPTAVGIIATRPGWLLGQETKDSVQLALAGRVPVRVSLRNGEIKPGDPITTSSIPGIGMKATKAGPIVGKAMEALNETSALNTCVDPTTGRDERCGTVLTFVNVSWYSPTNDLSSEDTASAAVPISNEPFGFDDDFAEGDVASFYNLDAPAQGHPDEIETVRRVAKADGSSAKPAVGVISTEIGGPGDLLRRTRENNKITSEIRLVHDGSARIRIAPNSAAVAPGDSLAIAPMHPGQAAKAWVTGPTIARALEAWTPDSHKETIAVWVGGGWYDPLADDSNTPATTTTEALLADLSTSWWFGAFASASQSLKDKIAHLAGETIRILGETVYAATGIFEKVMASEITAQNISADMVKTNTLCLDDVCITKTELRQLFDLRSQVAAGALIQTQDVEETPPDAPPPPDILESAPVDIVMNGNPSPDIPVGSTYADLGATASTSSSAIAALGVRTFYGGAETPNVTVDTATPGDHDIVYRIIDGSGTVLAEATRVVRVIASVPTEGSETATSTTP